MSADKDIWIGQLALKKGLISGAQFIQALELQKNKYREQSLKDILVNEGFLNEIDLLYLHKLKETPPTPKTSKKLFGEIALEKRWIGADDLEQALKHQETQFRMGNNRLLGEILITDFDLSLNQVLDILKEQKKSILKCIGCGAQYNVEDFREDLVFFCLTCNDMLKLHREIHSVRVRLDSPKASQIKGYLFLQKIGTGEMGVVYKSKQKDTGQIVAIKILPPRLRRNQVIVKRFEQEAAALIRLSHPHIVKGLDVYVSAELCFYVMEYLEGRTVEEVLMEDPFPEKWALEVVLSTGKALECAHEMNLIHRDIKPSNIFIDSQGVAKLFDLGLMKNPLSAMHLTGPGAVVGTPVYMSPEQALGKKDLDIRSDIYSLGMTLVHMITGRRPYQDMTISEIYSRFFKNIFFDPSYLEERISPPAYRILTKMLASQREERYGNPSELVRDIEEYLG